MNVLLTVAELKFALAGLLRIIPKRANLEVLHGVLIQTSGLHLRVSATDLESCATYHASNANVAEPGPNVAVDVQRLKDALGLSSQGDVVLSLTASGLLRVSVKSERGTSEMVLPVLDATEFPPPPAEVDTRAADPAFLARFQTAAPFCSTDPSRFILQGVCLERQSNGSHTLVATDGRRMTAFPGLKLPLDISLVVPCTKFLLGLKAGEDVRVGHGPVIEPTKETPNPPPPWFHLHCGPWHYAGRTIDGKFPQWRQVVPGTRPPHQLVIAQGDVDLLVDALHTLPGNEGKADRCVRLVPSPQGCPRLLAYDLATETTAHRDLPGSRMTGPAEGITLNRNYLLESAKAGFLSFGWSDELSPMLAELREGEGGALIATHILMPMRRDGPIPRASEKVHANPVPAPEPSVALVAPTETDTGHTPPKTHDHTTPNPNPGPETSTHTPPMITPDPIPPVTGAASPVDQLLAAYTAAKEKISAAGNALVELGGQLKALRKQDRARQSELDNARALLVRLQTVKI